MRRRISDQVADARAVRGELVTELQALLAHAEGEGRVLSEVEQKRFDKLSREIETGDQHLENLRVAESAVARGAMTRVMPDRNGPQLERGIGAARLVQLLIASKGR
jgi:hypothetical protein